MLHSSAPPSRVFFSIIVIWRNTESDLRSIFSPHQVFTLCTGAPNYQITGGSCSNQKKTKRMYHHMYDTLHCLIYTCLYHDTTCNTSIQRRNLHFDDTMTMWRYNLRYIAIPSMIHARYLWYGLLSVMSPFHEEHNWWILDTGYVAITIHQDINDINTIPTPITLWCLWYIAIPYAVHMISWNHLIHHDIYHAIYSTLQCRYKSAFWWKSGQSEALLHSPVMRSGARKVVAAIAVSQWHHCQTFFFVASVMSSLWGLGWEWTLRCVITDIHIHREWTLGLMELPSQPRVQCSGPFPLHSCSSEGSGLDTPPPTPTPAPAPASRWAACFAQVAPKPHTKRFAHWRKVLTGPSQASQQPLGAFLCRPRSSWQRWGRWLHGQSWKKIERRKVASYEFSFKRGAHSEDSIKKFFFLYMQ